MKKSFAWKKSAAAAMLALLVALTAWYVTPAQAAQWSFAEGSSITGLNVNASSTAMYPSMIDFNGKLYAGWSELTGSSYQLRVKKYDDASGGWISGDDGSPINVKSSDHALRPSFAVYGGALYVAWDEGQPSIQNIRVKKLVDGIWKSVDGGGANGLNIDVTKSATNARLVVYKDVLYLFWEEDNAQGRSQIRAKKYAGTGSTWTAADGGASLNVSSSDLGRDASLAVQDGKLYMAFTELDNKGEFAVVHVKAFDGTNWTLTDNPVSGINVNASQSASTPSLAVYGEGAGQLYVAWNEYVENAQNPDMPAAQTRVKKWNGSAWVSAEGGSLNYDQGYSAYKVNLRAYAGKLYAAWSEEPSYQIRVKAYDGQAWSWADGGSDQGINSSLASQGMMPYLEVHARPSGDELFAVFIENSQVRVTRMAPPNAAPTASAVNFTGTLKEGHTLTGTYDYADNENDEQGTTKFKWYTASDSAGTAKVEIAGATSEQLQLTNAQVGKYIVFEVTPVAKVGTITGTPATYASAAPVAANAAPTASAVSFTGTLKEGSTLEGSYTYGDVENDEQGETTFKWYTATDAAGTAKTVIADATTSSLQLTTAQVGKHIVFEVTPISLAGTTTGTPVTYTSATPVAANAAPTATGVHATGGLKLLQTLTGSYAYADAENDAEAEGASIYQWYVSDDADGTNKTAIAGATGKTLVLKAAQYGKFVSFEVTPVASTGTATGASVESAPLGPVGVLKGDVNGDGYVSPADALIANKYITGKTTLTDEQKVILDMDDDGDVDTDDAKIILAIYNGERK
ncbi:dockerin type I domain-containing protein [Cohnella sp. GCM10012308]|uniref:dockerin type I domain-containing protein n=1 Tax=Cohnella sp. GCM10012308 TaxID=3317329 RepID=UPI0036236438